MITRASVREGLRKMTETVTGMKVEEERVGDEDLVKTVPGQGLPKGHLAHYKEETENEGEGRKRLNWRGGEEILRLTLKL